MARPVLVAQFGEADRDSARAIQQLLDDPRTLRRRGHAVGAEAEGRLRLAHQRGHVRSRAVLLTELPKDKLGVESTTNPSCSNWRYSCS